MIEAMAGLISARKEVICIAEKVIFRRYRRGKNGELLDARKYGYRAWPIKVKDDQSSPKKAD